MTIIVIQAKTLLASSVPFGTWIVQIQHGSFLVVMRNAISCDDNFSRLRKYTGSELCGKQWRRRRGRKTDDIFRLGPSCGSPSKKDKLGMFVCSSNSIFTWLNFKSTSSSLLPFVNIWMRGKPEWSEEQRPPLYNGHLCLYRRTVHTITLILTSSQRQWLLKRAPTAKVTSRQRPVNQRQCIQDPGILQCKRPFWL